MPFPGSAASSRSCSARFITEVKQERRQSWRNWDPGESWNRGYITLNSGDNFLASPSFNASVANGIYYDAVGLDALKYDAIINGSWSHDVAENRFFEPSARRKGGPNTRVPKLCAFGLPRYTPTASRPCRMHHHAPPSCAPFGACYNQVLVWKQINQKLCCRR